MTLWKKRLQEALGEVFKYGKYVFNDHASIFLFFLLIGGAVLYQKWLLTIPAAFPWAALSAMGIALSLNVHPNFTFLKRADLVFLSPREESPE